MSEVMSQALWALGRGTGAVALILFTVSVSLGIIARSGRPLPRIGRFGAAQVHGTAALTATGLIIVHVASLTVDPYAQLHLVDSVVPFLGSYRPVWLGLGTLAVDLLAVITAVSLLRHRVGPRVFHAVHLSTYVMWPLAMLHAVGTGTDAGAAWLNVVAVASTACVAAATAWRLTPGFAERGFARIPREVGR